MARENCPYAERKRGSASLFCRKLAGEKVSYCGHQYLCPDTRRWEATKQAGSCPLRKDT